MGNGWPVPANVSRPALSLAAVALALFGIARTTGSGWLIVILTGIGSVVALAAVLPPFGLRRLDVDVRAPRDGTVGRTCELTVDVLGGNGRPVKLRVHGFTAPWTGVLTPATGQLAVVPSKRGVVESVRVELRSAAPFGLVWWKRTVVVDLARPLEIGPSPTTESLDAPTGRDDSGREEGRVTTAMADTVRTVREYAAGDPIKLIHWAATARAGELMTKELESPVVPALCIALDLRGGADDAVEAAASRAAGLALDGLAAGIPVLLLTAEKAGPRSGPVTTPGEANRRLARAVPGPLPQPPRGAAPVVVSAR